MPKILESKTYYEGERRAVFRQQINEVLVQRGVPLLTVESTDANNERAYEVYKNELTEVLKFHEGRALDAYAALNNDETLAQIETNEEHGKLHIRRVIKHAEAALLSRDVYNDEKARAALYDFVPATTLALKDHDIIQQYLDSLEGKYKETRFKHGEIAALYLMIFSKEFYQFGYSKHDIYSAAFMAYHHSKPENISSKNPEMPSFAKLRNKLQSEIAATAAKGKSIPLSLLEFLPIPPGMTREEVEARLSDDNWFEAPQLDAQSKENRNFYARRMAISDKLDSLTNERSIDTAWDKRPFFKEMTADLALQVVQERKAEIEKDFDPQNEGQQFELISLNKLLTKILEHQAQFPGEQLLLEVEFDVRLIAGGAVTAEGSLDDGNRMWYELMRAYGDLVPLPMELYKFVESFEERAKHYLLMARHLAGDVFDEQVQAYLDTHKNPRQKTVKKEDLPRIQALIELALVKLKVKYEELKVHRPANPAVAMSYTPEHPITLEQAIAKYRSRAEKYLEVLGQRQLQ